ncbi:unnamed protein product [Amoebophrya sp. A120]|nr:unnamed protein product [Amoebophrya sp. A120]|eukprot:GSA120T00004274001.1
MAKKSQGGHGMNKKMNPELIPEKKTFEKLFKSFHLGHQNSAGFKQNPPRGASRREARKKVFSNSFRAHFGLAETAQHAKKSHFLASAVPPCQSQHCSSADGMLVVFFCYVLSMPALLR